MKKLLKITGIVVLVFFAALLLLPVLFKGKIKDAVDAFLAETLTTDVYYDVDQIGVSVFSNFPNVTISLGDFGLVGTGNFQGDTLVAANKLAVELSLLKVISGNFNINGVTLDEPRVLIMVLPDGSANYDILADTGQPAEASSTEESSFSVGIDHWQIQNGHFVYYDLSLGFMLDLDEITHTGSGNITLSEYDLETFTRANKVTLIYDDVEYVSEQRLTADAALHIDLNTMTFTFKENDIQLNEFDLVFDGAIGLVNDDITFDITFITPDNTFKSLLSVVPGVYAAGFEDLETVGNVAFNGAVKGNYGADKIPGFDLNLKVQDGGISYASMPESINDVDIEASINLPANQLENLAIEVPVLHALLGQNPVDGMLSLKGLERLDIDAFLKGQVELASIANVVPLQGLGLKGTFNLDALVQGVYDAAANEMPSVKAVMQLKNGFIKYDDLPLPVSNIGLDASVYVPKGSMEQAKLNLTNLGLEIDGDRIQTSAVVQNFNAPIWDVVLDASLDLAKIKQVYQVQDADFAGKIKANVKSKGSLTALNAGRYQDIPTSGSLQLTDFSLQMSQVPPVSLSVLDLGFEPDQIALKQFKAKVASSDLDLTGVVENYLPFILEENQTLTGKLVLRSNNFNIDELMPASEETTTEDTTALAVVPIPQNLTFTIDTKVQSLTYDGLELQNVEGVVQARDGLLDLQGLTFGLLDGRFAMNGLYDPRNTEAPIFDFTIDIKDLSVQRAFKQFSTIRAMAPVAENVTGKFSTKFSLNGLLDGGMMPQLNSLTGSGLVSLANAALQNSKIVNGISNFTKLDGAEKQGVDLKDLLLSVKVKDGRVSVEPFDVKLGKYTATVSGGHRLNGNLDYGVSMDVPAGAAGKAANNLIGNLTGTNAANAPSTLNLNFGVTGSPKSPNVGLKGASPSGAAGTNALAGSVKNQVKQEVDTKAEEVKEKLNQQTQQAKDSVKNEVKQETEKAVEKAKEKAKEKVKGLFKKKGGGGRPL